MSIRIATFGAGFMGAFHSHIGVREMPGATLQLIRDVCTIRAKIVADSNITADVANPDFHETPTRLAA